MALAAGAAALLLRPRAPRETRGGTPPSLHPAVAPQRVIATPPPTPEPPPTPSPAPVNAPLERVGESASFVLLGRESWSLSTDTVLAGRFDTATGALDAVSIPRDTLVDVEWGVKKINSVLRFGEGPEAVLDVMEGLLGFRPDYYIILDAAGVEALFDAAGGLYYNVERDYDYDDPVQDLHIHVPGGLRQLSGAEAVQILRFRVGNDGTGYPDGDLGRIRTQQGLLAALASRWREAGEIPNAARVGELFFELAETNLTPEQLAACAAVFLSSPEEPEFFTAPGTSVCIRGGYYYQLDPKAWTELINAALNPWSAPVEVSQLDVLREFGEDGAVSTHGDVIPMESFFDYDALG
ncbi:MAG: LCP family protein [Oscillospiraceae bacterium]|nr:LCP family protein [Oscillospiraceae bacterium]